MAKTRNRTPIIDIPLREDVNPDDRWDLSSLYKSDKAWEKDFAKWKAKFGDYSRFQGRLAEGPAVIAEALAFHFSIDEQGERLGVYAHLRMTENLADFGPQRMVGRYMAELSRVNEAASFLQPELLAIPEPQMWEYMADAAIQPYRLFLERLLRYRPHTLSRAEERLLAAQTELLEAPQQVFRQLNDTELDFGSVRNERKESVPLTHGTYLSLLESPSREVRREAFRRYYTEYAKHQRTLAAALGGAILADNYLARVRNYANALEAALFPDNVPVTVYDNLIRTVRDNIEHLHGYHDLRRRRLRLTELEPFDLYVPLVPGMKKRRTWEQAVEMVVAALEPLGAEYVRVLRKGLLGRWCDRYENQNKQSGAFSSGTYRSDPYILMNYKEDVLDHVFTLAHEAGHSMHTYYSAKRQPYLYYQYPILVAEVASTFNEQLLSRRLLEQAKSDAERALIISHELDSIRGTIFRQTMFAEFEKKVHLAVQEGEPPTLELFTSIYADLLHDYLGPGVVVEPYLKLECLRIPHFYRGFYVYKYATGLSAAIALADRVLQEGEPARRDYLRLLASGCSKDPLELFRDAGVDLEKPETVQAAMRRFAELTNELATLFPKVPWIVKGAKAKGRGKKAGKGDGT
ncbi:oligoendopeptidase F [Thermopirellula anaerolimosa]